MPETEIPLLLRLLERGSIREATRTGKLIERFRRARWIETSSRAGEWSLAVEARPKVEARLGELLPSWQADVLLLRSHGLEPTEAASIRALPALRNLPRAAGFLHRKVWNAASAAGSKVPSRIVTDAVLTDDWAQRGRVNCGTIVRTADGDVDLLDQTRLLGEFSIPERCWRGAKGFAGELPQLVLTVENLGPLVDLVLPQECMVLFSQGAAVHGSAEMLRALPTAVWLHFGDLDIAGIECGMRLATLAGRPPAFYVPSFAADYLHRAARVRQAWRGKPLEHPVLQELVRRNAWLEQEVFLLDERLVSDIALTAASAGSDRLSFQCAAHLQGLDDESP